VAEKSISELAHLARGIDVVAARINRKTREISAVIGEMGRPPPVRPTVNFSRVCVHSCPDRPRPDLIDCPHSPDRTMNFKSVPWKSLALLALLAALSPLASASLTVMSTEGWLMQLVYWWFFALPTAGYMVGIPTDESLAATSLLYTLQYTLIWWALRSLTAPVAGKLQATAAAGNQG
jgi:hypothetical protein